MVCLSWSYTDYQRCFGISGYDIKDFDIGAMYTMGTPVNILTALILLVLLSTECDAVEFTVNQFKHAKLIKKEELPDFKKSNTISVLYYFLKGKLHT